MARVDGSSEVLVEVLFRDAEVGLALLDPAGTIVRVNARWSQALGFPVGQELVGRDLRDVAPELGRWRETAGLAPLGEARPVPQPARFAGTTWQMTATPVPLAEGVGLLFTAKSREPATDAQASDDAREELRALQGALEALPIGVLLVERSDDGVLRLVAQNRAHELTVGVRVAAGATSHQVPYGVFLPDRVTPFPPEERPGAKAVRTGRSVRDVLVHALRPDGEWRVLEGSAEPLPGRDGRPRRAVAVTLDVTERERAREELREREERYRAVFTNISDAVGLLRAVRDADGAIVDWRFLDANEGLARLLRRSLDDLKGRGYREVAPGRFEVVGEDFARVLRTGERWRYQVAIGGSHHLVTVFRVDEETLGAANVDISDLKAAESSLRRSEMQLRQLVEHAPVGIALMDREMRYLAVSHRLARDYGFAAEALLGRRPHDVFPHIAAGWTDVQRRCLAGASERAEEDLFAHADGRTDWVTWEIQPWYTPEGEVGGLVLFTSVITERKLAADRLAATKERLAVTLASIGDAVIATDESERVTMINPIASALTGWSAEEAVGRPLPEIFDIVNEDSGLAVPPPTERVLREGLVVGLANHTVLVAKDGARRPIADSAAPIRDEGGVISGVVLVFRDQTEERKAEAELVRSRQEFKALVEKLPLGVLVTVEGTIVYANAVFASYVGEAEAGHLVGRSPQALTAPGTAPLVPLAGKEWTVLAADGATVPLACASIGEVDFEGRGALLYACRDLRELKQLQAQVLQNDRMATLGLLAAGVAHEINNPLTYLLSSLELAEEDVASMQAAGKAARDDELAELRSFIADARHGARRVQAIVRDLRAFSRPEKDDAKSLDLRKVLDAAVGMVANQIGHRARLVRAYGDAPRVNASEARLGQVFINLLVNAAQAIEEGRPEENEIRVVLGTDESGSALVEIRDTGAGIPPPVMERIFDPFFTTKGAGGTGLGLSISRNTVVSLGGDIRLESKPGWGTTARVVLPPGVEGGEAAARPALVGGGPRRGRVLVVDDEARICGTLRRALESDHDVVTEEQAETAEVRLARGERFDVVFCDVMMPGMSGIELYQAACRLCPAQAERFVFISGGTFTQAAEDFLGSVKNTRLGKPFDLQELRALVNRAVR